MSALLELREVGVTRGASTVLSSVDLSVQAGERVAVVGPNGAGKSTMLHVAAGIVEPSTGTVTLGGEAIGGLSRRDIARRVALMTQQFTAAFAFSVLETVLLGRTPHLGGLGFAGAEDAARAESCLEALEVEELRDRSVLSLSGGERQRVHFARAWVQEAPLLLLDEPTSAQDFAGAARILDAIAGLSARGIGAVVVLHDLNVAARAFPRMVLIDGGRIAADGPPDEVLRCDAMRTAYGDAFDVLSTPDGAPMVLPRLSGA